MFKKKMSFFIALLLPFFGLWIYQIAVVRPSDLEEYKNRIEQKKLSSSHFYSPTNQHRKQVRKDIWFSQQDHSRLHYQMISEGSLLTLNPIKNKFEVVESLQGIKCWMQDKLTTNDHGQEPMQQARLIEAENGLYHYKTQEFTATGVHLSLFKLPGHSLPKEPVKQSEAFLRGVAHDISFFFSGRTPQFQAGQLKTTVAEE